MILMRVDLPGPVLAHERVDFAGLDAEIDVIERPHAGKRFRYAQHFNPRRQSLRHARRRMKVKQK